MNLDSFKIDGIGKEYESRRKMKEEAARTGDQAIGTAVLDELRSLLGAEHVKTGPEASGRFLRPGRQAPGLTVVSPESTENVQTIVNLARVNRVPVLTCNDRYLLQEDLEREAVLLDFSRMSRIEQIDDRNLAAHVERGVTWDQLNAELKKRGVKTVAPAATLVAQP